MVALLVVALAGLMVLQVHLLGRTLAAKQEAFARNVRTALVSTALRHQAGELAGELGDELGDGPFRLVFSDVEVSAEATGFPMREIPVRATCDSTFAHLVVAHIETEAGPAVAPDPDLEIDPAGPADHAVQAGLARRVLDDLSSGERPPWRERVDPVHLDSLLTASLADFGIANRFVFGIASGDSLVLAPQPEFPRSGSPPA